MHWATQRGGTTSRIGAKCPVLCPGLGFLRQDLRGCELFRSVIQESQAHYDQMASHLPPRLFLVYQLSIWVRNLHLTVLSDLLSLQVPA